MKNKPKIILGAVDFITAYLCSKASADYIWASSFIMSAMAGLQDKGMVNIKYFLPLITSLIKGSTCPVILDFDVGGRNLSEYRSQVNFLKNLPLGGICIEDEKWPKVNAMLKSPVRHLVSPEKMALKIKIARETLDSKQLIIARTHSLIKKEPFIRLQHRIDIYQNAGADVICVHYTEPHFDFYQEILRKISFRRPLLFILSSFVPPLELFRNFNVKYILFPNQIYRMMLYPVFHFISRNRSLENLVKSFKNKKELISTKEIFKITEDINKSSTNKKSQ